MKCLATLVVVLLAAGCQGLKTDYRRPDTGVPASWHLANVNTAAVEQRQAWWTEFADPVLQNLITAALEDNRDLAIAAARIEEARANVGLVRSAQFPVVGVQTGAGRARSLVPTTGNARIANSFVLEAVASYEVDLWGRLARSSAAARADLLATRYALEAVRLALIGDVARSYFALRSLDLQLEIAQRTRVLRESALKLAERRWRGGVTSELDFRQAEVELQSAIANSNSIEQRLAVEQSTLSLLLGRFPFEIERGLSLDLLSVPPDIPVGLPSELLRRRPDILDAEEGLVAANARLDATRALYFPTIALTGSAGWASASLSSLVSGGTLAWQLAASLAQPIFNAGRTRAQVDIVTAQQEQLVHDYVRTVQTAFAEVENALIGIRTAGAQYATQDAQIASLERTLTLANTRYKNGYTNFLEVLDAQRSLFSAQLARVQARESQLAAFVTLYRALGGGWEPPGTEIGEGMSAPGP